MASLKKYSRLKANSLIESVVALCIISTCLYIAILVFANVFTSESSMTFYNKQQQINELFFLKQLGQDTLNEKDFIITEEIVKLNLKKITVQDTASRRTDAKKSFYVQTDSEK